MLAYLHTIKWQAFTQTDLQAIDAVAAPAKKTGNRRHRRARLQSGPGAAA